MWFYLLFVVDDTLMKLKCGAKKVLAEQDANISENLPEKLQGCHKSMKQTELYGFLRNPVVAGSSSVAKVC